MTILVTGSTGRIGAHVVAQLARSSHPVRALTRSPEKAKFPAGVSAVKGDLLDADAVRAALVGVKTLFLLVSNSPDELTQAVNTLGLARESGVQGIVYLSVTRSGEYTDVSHFTAKHAVERMIEQMDLPATVLRPPTSSRTTRCRRILCRTPGSMSPRWATSASRWWTCETLPMRRFSNS